MKVKASFPETENFLKRNLNHFFIDTLGYIPAKIVPALANVSFILIFTRIFNAEEYGRYSVIMAIVVLLTMLLSQWVRQSILRFFNEYQKKEVLSLFYKNLITLSFLLVLFIIGLGAIFYTFSSSLLGNYSQYYLSSIILILSNVIFINFLTIFQAKLEPRKYAKYEILSGILKLILPILFVLLISRNIISILLGATLSYLFPLYFMLKDLRLTPYFSQLKLFINIGFLKRFASYGFPMIGWLLGAQILDVSDRFLIEHFSGSQQVGIYSANYRLVSSGIWMVFYPILMAAHPIIMNSWRGNNKEEMVRLISSITRYFLIIFLPLAGYISLFSRDIINLCLGKAFREGYVILPIVILGITGWNLAMIGHKGFEIRKKTKIVFILVILCAITNIFLNIILIPRFGYIGAAYATLISYLIYPMLVFFYSKHYIPWVISWKSFFKISAAAACAVGALYYIRKLAGSSLDFIGLLLAFFGYSIIYIILLILFKEFTPRGKIRVLRNLISSAFLHSEN